MSDDILYKIALSIIPGVGGVTARKLISYCGSVENVFKEKKQNLLKIPGIGPTIAGSVFSHRDLQRAEEEVLFIEKHKIQVLFFLDRKYPARLKQCEDGPIILYTKGNADLNTQKVVGIVGTRSITEYGHQKCQELVKGLVAHDVLVVSGLAYGVDACAHKSALERGLVTAAVLGHGLDLIYPAVHSKLARRIIDNGCLVTDFVSKTKPDRENFPKRNRIIAGLCDAIIVVEAAATGGALITANLANDYNRDVFAVPGRTTDSFSAGCNKLIKINKASLLTEIKDLEYIMGWDKAKANNSQQSLFVDLDPEEEKMVSFLREFPGCGIDFLVAKAGFTVSKTTAILLNLEFKGVVMPLPGKLFKIK
jgi:DNA processing protein